MPQAVQLYFLKLFRKCSCNDRDHCCKPAVKRCGCDDELFGSLVHCKNPFVTYSFYSASVLPCIIRFCNRFCRSTMVFCTSHRWIDSQLFAVLHLGRRMYLIGSSFLLLSFFSITAVSFDRYLALVLHLRYATIVTVSRVIKFNLFLFSPVFPLSIYFWFSREDWFKLR